MTALTATPNAATASVLLQITAAPAGPVSISATDANGVRSVRLRAGQEPSAGVLTVTDYEASLTGSISYTVTDAAGAAVTALTSLTVTNPVISAVGLPQYATALDMIEGYAADRTTAGVTHDVIGRADYLVTLGPLRRRRGQLRLWFTSWTAASALDQLAARGEPLLLRQASYPGMDMYLACDACRIEPAEPSGRRWVAIVTYTEIARPTTPLLGAAGWTCASVAAWGTCAQVRSSFATCAALVVGPA